MPSQVTVSNGSIDGSRPIRARIFRFDPTRDREPRYETFELPYEKGMRILCFLERIREQGSDLAFMSSCGMAKCGTCSVSMNGRPVLSCLESVEEDMVIEPLAFFPVIRDLVIDRTGYNATVTALKPYLHRSEPYKGYPEKLRHHEMRDHASLMECVECLCCQSICPVLDLERREKTSSQTEFIGPAPLVQLAKLAFDPRDSLNRAALALRAMIEKCVSCYECVHVCPVEVSILECALDRMREKITIAEPDSILARHIAAFTDILEDEGLVNPTALILKTKGLAALGKLPLAIKMFRRGKVKLRKERIPNINRIRRLTTQWVRSR